jgi:hypothetical protein
LNPACRTGILFIVAFDPNDPRNLAKGMSLILEKMARYEAILARQGEQAAEYFKRVAEQAAEDRKQAAEDRKQAAEDRKRSAEREDGIRKALAVIGHRGGEFVKIQKGQAEQLRKLTEISEKNSQILQKNTEILEKNTEILQAIHKTLRIGQNGKP